MSNVLDIIRSIAAGEELNVDCKLERHDVDDVVKRDPQEVRRSLDAIVCATDPSRGLTALMTIGFISAVLPEIAEIVSLGDGEGVHKDVWLHSLAVMRGVPPELDLRWAALLHDIGKARTRRLTGNTVTFHNHDIVGARMFDTLCKRTSLFNNDVALKRTVHDLISEHLRPASYNSSWSDSAVRRLLTECGDVGFFDKLMTLSRADLTTKNPGRRRKCERRANELEARASEILASLDAPRLPKGVMGSIIAKSGRDPAKFANALKLQMETLMAEGVVGRSLSAEEYVVIGLRLLDCSSC